MPRGQRPTPVSVVVILLWVSVVVGAVVAALFFMAAGNESELVKVAAERGVDPATLRTTNLAIAWGALVGAVIAAIFALRLGRGGRVARLVYTVLAAVGIVGNATTALQSGQWYHWLLVILPVVVLALLWAPKSSQRFFARGGRA